MQHHTCTCSWQTTTVLECDRLRFKTCLVMSDADAWKRTWAAVLRSCGRGGRFSQKVRCLRIPAVQSTPRQPFFQCDVPGQVCFSLERWPVRQLAVECAHVPDAPRVSDSGKITQSPHDYIAESTEHGHDMPVLQGCSCKPVLSDSVPGTILLRAALAHAVLASIRVCEARRCAQPHL